MMFYGFTYFTNFQVLYILKLIVPLSSLLQGVGGVPQPAASNMYELKWSNELAKVAQRWTDQCPTFMNAHDKNRVMYAIKIKEILMN